MENTKFTSHIQRFRLWKSRQLRTLGQLEPWLKHQGLFTSEAQRAIHHARLTLTQDHINVAVVGEFSRGKTELINALFFSNHNFRLLPTDAGRTTMCPTEIFQDDREAPYLNLLPIDTRENDASIGELKKSQDLWVKIPLDPDNPQQLHDTMLKIKETRSVSRATAHEMGLLDATRNEISAQSHVKIPAWRLAQLNYPHPLLAQGLRILDTPGLNTVSMEMELTSEMLPNTQARLFVLGADTGVTQSDLDAWHQFIAYPGSKHNSGIMVILNKTDTLWDELRPEGETHRSIKRQCQEVADILQIETSQVFPLSAQKALVARVKNNKLMERRSGILEMEKYLASMVVNNRQQLIIEQSTRLVGSAIESVKALVKSRLKRMQTQARELSELSSKGEQAINEMLSNTYVEKERYQASINAYKNSRAEFAKHGKLLLNALSAQELDLTVRRAHKKMVRAWTTMGLKKSVGLLFTEINQHMQAASDQSQEMRRLIRTTHRRFQSRHDMQLGEPRMFSIIKHQVELNLVHQESEIFRNSPRTALTEQHFAVRRYFQTIIRRVEDIFRSARSDSKDWLDTALDPLTLQIHEHRTLLSQRMSDLKNAGQSRTTVKQRLVTLKRETKHLEIQLASLKNVAQALSNTKLPEADGSANPEPVKQSA